MLFISYVVLQECSRCGCKYCLITINTFKLCNIAVYYINVPLRHGTLGFRPQVVRLCLATCCTPVSCSADLYPDNGGDNFLQIFGSLTDHTAPYP
jgi:hypothetical protein